MSKSTEKRLAIQKIAALRRCDVCGLMPAPSLFCTNGRCPDCHAKVCTPGGNTTPGHGRGKATS